MLDARERLPDRPPRQTGRSSRRARKITDAWRKVCRWAWAVVAGVRPWAQAPKRRGLAVRLSVLVVWRAPMCFGDSLMAGVASTVLYVQ